MNSRSPIAAWRNSVTCAFVLAAALSLGVAVTVAVPGDALAKRKSKSKSASVVKKPDLPLVINISLRRQRLTVFEGDKVITGAPVSSGSSGRETPLGIFSVIAKRRMHYSNLYNSAPMPFMQRITWSGIALHHGKLPGYPASHGCIRMPYDFSKKLFSITGRGTRIIVSRDPIRPRNYQHARLFKPLPPVAAVPEIAAPAAEVGSNPAAPGSKTAGSKAAGTQSAANQTAGSQLTTSSAIVVAPAAAGLSKAPPAATQSAPGASQAPPVTTKIQPAATAMAPFPGRLNRAQLVAARKAGLQELKTTVKSAKTDLKMARRTVKARQRATVAASSSERFVKVEVRKLNKNVSKVERVARKAALALISFENRIAGTVFDPVIDGERFTKAVALEDELEGRYFDLVEEVELARHDAGAMKTRLASDRSAVNRAREAQVTAKDAVRQAVAALDAAKEAYKLARRAEARYRKPIAVFISRKKRRIYVRQGFEDVLDAPVTIADPDQPMGTHIYTALEFNAAKTGLDWSVVSIKGDAARTTKSRRSRRKRNKGKQEKTFDLSPGMLTADRALERIAIPTDVLYRIAELVKPGSSLIISDRRKSHETGWGTDFIVSLR